MAKKQKKEPLTYMSLLDELLFIKERSEQKEINLTVDQIRSLKFIRKDATGKTSLVDSFKLNLVKYNGEVAIIMLPK